MYRKLSNEEFKNEAFPQLLALCGTTDPDPYRAPFTDKVECKQILYQYTYILNLEQKKSIESCVGQYYGDDGFFVSALGGSHHKDNIPSESWYVPFNEYEDFYRHIPVPSVLVLENIMYSQRGNWGIISSDEWHAVIGGANDFIQLLNKAIPDLDDQVFGFLNLWNAYHKDYGTKVDWLPTLMGHVYGEEQGKNILLENGFDFLFE